LLGASPAPASPTAAAAFALSLLLGISVGLALDFVFAGLIVATEGGIWLIDRVRNALNGVLSGALVPLALLPWGLGGVFGWLPFAQLASTPLRLYTGTGPVAQLLATQAAWSLALWPLAGWVWRANRERLAGYGG
jgi:viologen exporter family transport system permease protein